MSTGADATFTTYTPSSVIGIFNNALKLPATVNLIYLKGRYNYGGGKAYVNYYYDLLFSESDNVSIGVKMPGLLRTKIVNNEVYTLRGYIEKRLRNSSIELILVVDEIVSQEEKTISEEDLKKYGLIQKKLEQNSADLQTLIREKILSNQKIAIANIYGHNAIVQKDFYEGLDVSSSLFEITDFACNITSATSIISKLTEVAGANYDIIALVRGGGDRQSFEVFNDITLSEKFIELNALTVTALGHTVDETLLDKLSDRRFHLPHDYGSNLHAIVNKLAEEKSNSRAILIAEVKKDVTKQFEEQVRTLSEQLANKNKEFMKFQEDSAKQISQINENNQKQLYSQSEDMKKYKNEIASLHEKNLSSAVQTATASLSAKIDVANKENARLQEELDKKKKNTILYVILIVIGIAVSYLLSKS